jgi:RecA-family ATPase
LELVKDVESLIRAIRMRLDVDPVKISLDTLNRSMSGSESKDADMSAYLAAADQLREEFNCFVNIIHHPGWDTTRLRGHSSLQAGVDVEVEITTSGKLLSTMEVRKMKDGESGLTLS